MPAAQRHERTHAPRNVGRFNGAKLPIPEAGSNNPFDPEEAIPKSAELLADLKQRFGNLGLAAAYNAGPARVANWLAGHGNLPAETRAYVLIIARHPVEDWIACGS